MQRIIETATAEGDVVLDPFCGCGTSIHAAQKLKGGRHLNPAMIRELHGTVGQEGADVGIFVCLETPTRDMKLAATAAGFVDLEGRKVPKIQIVTISDLFTSARPVDLPPIYTTSTVLDAVKKAAPRSLKRPKPDELRKSPPLKLPIPGGKDLIKRDVSVVNTAATKPANRPLSPTKLKSLRREPQLKLPIAGGKSATKGGQYTIDLPDLSMAAEGKSHYRSERKHKNKR